MARAWRSSVGRQVDVLEDRRPSQHVGEAPRFEALDDGFDPAARRFQRLGLAEPFLHLGDRRRQLLRP